MFQADRDKNAQFDHSTPLSRVVPNIHGLANYETTLEECHGGPRHVIDMK